VTSVFYIPPHSLSAVLTDLSDVLGPRRRCCVARELTKMYETFERGTLGNMVERYAEVDPQGEVTLCVEGPSDEDLRAFAESKVCRHRMRLNVSPDF
jgi:16S rRNA (cytidine1402-2'-O)-methyltransferase